MELDCFPEAEKQGNMTYFYLSRVDKIKGIISKDVQNIFTTKNKYFIPTMCNCWSMQLVYWSIKNAAVLQTLPPLTFITVFVTIPSLLLLRGAFFFFFCLWVPTWRQLLWNCSCCDVRNTGTARESKYISLGTTATASIHTQEMKWSINGNVNRFIGHTTPQLWDEIYMMGPPGIQTRVPVLVSRAYWLSYIARLATKKSCLVHKRKRCR